MARARELLRVTMCAVVAVAVLFAVVRGGTRYFYCPMTELVDDEPLCTASHTTHSDGPAVDVADCCQMKRRPAAPTASTPEVQRVGVAPAGVAASPFVAQLDTTLASAKIPFVLRAGPAPPSASERRAHLMVFRN